MIYTCTDPNCEYCYQTKVAQIKGRPILPPEMQLDINRAGGYENWRDAALLENLKPTQSKQMGLARQRLSQRLSIKLQKSRKVRILA